MRDGWSWAHALNCLLPLPFLSLLLWGTASTILGQITTTRSRVSTNLASWQEKRKRGDDRVFEPKILKAKRYNMRVNRNGDRARWGRVRNKRLGWWSRWKIFVSLFPLFYRTISKNGREKYHSPSLNETNLTGTQSIFYIGTSLLKHTSLKKTPMASHHRESRLCRGLQGSSQSGPADPLTSPPLLSLSPTLGPPASCFLPTCHISLRAFALAISSVWTVFPPDTHMASLTSFT